MANDFDIQIKWLNGSQIEVQATDAGSLSGSEKVLIMDGENAKETTTQNIANLGSGNGGSGSQTLQQTLTSGNTANKDIEITDFTKGVILTSPDATRWRITINNSGALVTTQI